jgi:hypothetical protein
MGGNLLQLTEAVYGTIRGVARGASRKVSRNAGVRTVFRAAGEAAV